MKLISATDIALLRRLPRLIAATVIVCLWLAGMWFLYRASPYVPRWTTTSSHPGATWIHFADWDRTLVVGTRRDSTMTFWDVATGQPRRVIVHPQRRELLSVQVHAAGRFVQANYASGDLEIRDAATTDLVLRLPDPDYPAWAQIAISPDGKHLAAWPADRRKPTFYGAIPANPQVEPSPIELPTRDGRSVRIVLFSPDATRLLVVFTDETRADEFIVADSATGRRVSKLIDGFPLAWSPDGKRVLFAKFTNEIAVLDVASGAEIASLALPKNIGVFAAGFQRDSNTVVLVEAARTYRRETPGAVRMWDVAAKQTWLAATLPEGWRMASQFAAAQRRVVAFCSQKSDPLWRRLTEWLGRRQEETFELRAILYDLDETDRATALPAGTIVVSQDGTTAASIDHDTGAIAVWDVPPRINWLRRAGLAGLILAPLALISARCWKRRRLATATATPGLTSGDLHGASPGQPLSSTECDGHA